MSIAVSHNWKHFWAFLPTILFVCLVSAQKIDISVNSQNITTDDALVLTVQVSGIRGGSVPMPQWPEIKGMQAAGTSNSQQWINGNASISFSRNYFAPAPGKYKIPEFSYSFKGQTQSSKPITVTVTKGTGKPQNQNSFGTRMGRDPFANMFNDPFFGGSQQPQKPMTYKSLDADYFLSVNLDKETCYIGEQVHGEVVLYVAEVDARKIKVESQAILEMQQRVKNNGFWQEIIELKEIPANRVQINGKSYIAYTLYKNILFPVKTGEIAFKDIYLDGMKLAVATNADPISRFMGRDIKFENIKIKASDRKLEVKPLPPTKLPDAVMVGKFKVEAGLSDHTVETGKNLELEIKIAGNGNMAMMPDPIMEFPESFETYEPSTQYNSRVKGNGLLGDKTFKYSMLPTRSGKYDLGPFVFYFFDPEKAEYDSLTVDNLNVRVTGDDIENQRISKSGIDQFYSTALASSRESLGRGSGGAGWVLILGLLMATSLITVGVIRKKKIEKAKEHHPANDDFWA